MKNKSQIYRNKDWTILSFPRQDCSIVWDSVNKTYEFYQGTPWEQEKMREFRDRKLHTDKISQEKSMWKALSFILAAGLGVVSAMYVFSLLH